MGYSKWHTNEANNGRIVIRPSSVVVKAFDGSQSIVFREVDLLVKIGPHMCRVMLQQVYILMITNIMIKEKGIIKKKKKKYLLKMDFWLAC